jgi:hypothetical protein
LIQEAIADAMPIIRDIIVKKLKHEPTALLGQAAWDTLLGVAKVFYQETASVPLHLSRVIVRKESRTVLERRDTM